MAGYVYGGDQPLKPRGAPGGRPATGLAPFNPALCGSNAGYHQHARHKQDKCLRCKVAHGDYDATYRAKRKEAGFKRKRN
jgi:hypothetical protein